MIALLLQAASASPPALPPTDWSALPDLPVMPRRGAFDPSEYVRREVAVGRCAAPPTAGEVRIVVPVAILLEADGVVRRIVPRAIGCPTVEQFTAGYVFRLARRITSAEPMRRPGWYRYVVTYRWAV
ncbi:hypothetical protein [uncultured Sphingomonas sp.]|uniref:hypothetical protein n=1 Tax=uncultured Sphingomonas sp. TaxID=158754 RepID=UPI0035CB12F6